MQTDTPKADPREWRYSINYGPDGEANYAFVYDADGAQVSNLRTHHAIAVVDAMNRVAALTASGLSIVPVATGDVGELVADLRSQIGDDVRVSFLPETLFKRAASTLESLAAENARLNEECRLSMHTIADERARFEAANAELRAALEWAIAEIEGRTRYETDEQFDNALAIAHSVLVPGGAALLNAPRAPVDDCELQEWANLRADDAGRLARELIVYRRAASLLRKGGADV